MLGDDVGIVGAHRAHKEAPGLVLARQVAERPNAGAHRMEVPRHKGIRLRIGLGSAVEAVAAPTGAQQLAAAARCVALGFSGELAKALPAHPVPLSLHRRGVVLLPAAVLGLLAGRDMPLARKRQRIARVTEHLTKGGHPGVQRGVDGGIVQHVVIDAVAAGIQPRHKGGPRRTAVGRGGVGTPKAQPLRRQPIGVRGTTGVPRLEHPSLLLIRHDDEDIGSVVGHDAVSYGPHGLGGSRRHVDGGLGTLHKGCASCRAEQRTPFRAPASPPDAASYDQRASSRS